jgi:hypothetical protein
MTKSASPSDVLSHALMKKEQLYRVLPPVS